VDVHVDPSLSVDGNLNLNSLIDLGLGFDSTG
jgi:hypothetical protein